MTLVDTTAMRLVERQTLEAAVIRTLAYADVFDYPLTVQEIHRYLIGLSVSLAEIQAFLSSCQAGAPIRHSAPGFYTLSGREKLVEQREFRARASVNLWPQARAWGKLITRLPFVRMLAVTGALAVDNARPQDDIDYLVVTEPGRLWLCRALVIALVRAASLRGVRLCPNYFVSTQALVFAQRSLYSAHELVQMVPLSGLRIYSEMRRRNTWTVDYLPNAQGPPPSARLTGFSRPPGRPARLAERLLRSTAGEYLERWERQRKVEKFLAQAGAEAEVSFCADWCKGHFDHHGQDTRAAYRTRLQQLSLQFGFSLQE